MSRRLQSGNCTDALCLAVRTNALLKTKMCPKLETCILGKNCSYAHSDTELRPMPQFKKTAVCYNYKRGKCFDPDCKFAHGDEDMMGYIPQPSSQSRKICPYYISGSCLDVNCTNAHMTSRRAASRLRTYMITLRNALIGGEVRVSSLKKRLRGGIPWQSVGFSSFKESVLFLPGVSISADDQYVVLRQTPETSALMERLQQSVLDETINTMDDQTLTSVITPKSERATVILESPSDDPPFSLPLHPGEVIEINAETDTGWAYVTTPAGECGWAPISHLSVVEERQDREIYDTLNQLTNFTI